MELIALGRTTFIPGFALAGVKTELVNEENVLEKTFQKSERIILLDGTLVNNLAREDRERIETSISPIIITLQESDARETERLKQMIKTTLGVDILT